MQIYFKATILNFMHKYFKFFIQFFLIIGICNLNTIKLKAQTQPLSLQNISTIKIDDLSDEQIADFWTKTQANGFTLNHLEMKPKRSYMPT